MQTPIRNLIYFPHNQNLVCVSSLQYLSNESCWSIGQILVKEDKPPLNKLIGTLPVETLYFKFHTGSKHLLRQITTQVWAQMLTEAGYQGQVSVAFQKID